jgi:hypothetical protein
MAARVGSVNQKEIERVQWWLMWCDFPNLNWARLRVFADGSADVFDMDGRIFNFANEEEASHFLAEDEYSELSTLDEVDERELGMPLSSITPPDGTTDEEMLCRMYVRAE